MNLKLIVIILVVIDILYRLVLNFVSYRSANNPTPDNLKDVYDAEAYTKWKSYSAENCRLDLFATLTASAISLILLLFNVHATFAALFPQGMFLQLLSVIILESAINTVVGLIFSYIHTFKIEEKYGFNRSSAKTFVLDKIRGLVVELLLSLGIVCLLWWLHTAMGDWIILLFAIAIFIFTTAISFLYPILSRIGNKFTPLEDGDLKDRLMELLTKHGYQVRAIEVMDASRRTSKLNAYFTGFGKLKRIVLYDNLINCMTPDEICAVFAHELGHGLNKDVLKGQIAGFLNFFVMSFVIWAVVQDVTLFNQFGFAEINYGFAYVLLGAVLGIVQPFIGLFMNLRSRRAEYRADKQAVLEGYGEALITALKKLARENFAHLAPSKINVVLNYSHPPLCERISAIEKNLKN
jgi:STE24 endopeptidase